MQVLNEVGQEMSERQAALRTASMLCLVLKSAHQHAHRMREQQWVAAKRVDASDPLRVDGFWPPWMERDHPQTVKYARDSRIHLHLHYTECTGIT